MSLLLTYINLHKNTWCMSFGCTFRVNFYKSFILCIISYVYEDDVYNPISVPRPSTCHSRGTSSSTLRDGSLTLRVC